MARKGHFHASPVVLSLGLVVVMAFTIIMGVSQVKNSQDTRSRADETTSKSKQERLIKNFKGACNFSVAIFRPSSAPKETVHGEGDIFKCAQGIKSAEIISWFVVDGVNKFPERSSCPGACGTSCQKGKCMAGYNYDLSVVANTRNDILPYTDKKHEYCVNAYVSYTRTSGGTYKTPTISSGCMMIKGTEN